jgi:hypothetical protein
MIMSFNPEKPYNELPLLPPLLEHKGIAKRKTAGKYFSCNKKSWSA